MDPVTQSAARARLGRMFESGIAAATAFAMHLDAERKALEAQDLAALEQAARDKQHCLLTLELLENERAALLEESGYQNNHDGMRDLQNWCDRDGALAGQWQSYLQVASKCQQANMTNGAIMRLRQQQIASAIAALSGCSPQTYGPKGDNGNRGSRALAEA
ncbi:MAG: flagellar protein FlgN [Woeseia sp.]